LKAQHTDWLKSAERGSKPLLQMWMENTMLTDTQGETVLSMF